MADDPTFFFRRYQCPLSARTGEGDFDMVVMVRGEYNGKQWHELLDLTADNEDQILDWLDILPLHPIPPREPEPSVVGDHDEQTSSPRRLPEPPVGAQRPARRSIYSPTHEARPLETAKMTNPRDLPSRYHPRTASSRPMSYPLSAPQAGGQDHYGERASARVGSPPGGRDEADRDFHDNLRPDPLNLRKQPLKDMSYREDGAPAPPVHRTPSSVDAQQGNKPSKSSKTSADLKVKLD